MQNSGGSASTNDQSNPSHERAQPVKGLTPMEALEMYEAELTNFEKSELSTYDFIYTVGSVRIQSMRYISNKRGDYRVQVGE